MTAIIGFALVAASCSNANDGAIRTQELTEDAPQTSEQEPATDLDSGGTQESDSSSNRQARFASGDSAYLFDQDQLRTYELTLPDENLAELDADPAAEEYVAGTLTFDGESLPVGIRYKGSVGAFIGCLTGGNPMEPSGAKTCTKLSMKVKINWDGADTEFYGVRKLQFHSQNLDPTQMHDRLGYWLFRQMGVPAPRSVHARLIVNGEYVGLFSLVEQVDGRFTRENFDDGTGNLYKEVWPVDEDGNPQTDTAYLDGLRTNENDDPSLELIRGLADAIAEAGPDKGPQVVEEWMDIDEVIALLVVDRSIRHDDGPFHWYCFQQTCENHNFYWYEDPTQGKLHLIPWDLDNAFENIERDVSPVTPVSDGWGEVTADCSPFPYGAFNIEQRSAVCDPLFAAWFGLDSEYERLRDDFLAGPFSDSVVRAQVAVWAEQIAEATAEAGEAHRDALVVSRWEESVEDLLASLEASRQVS